MKDVRKILKKIVDEHGDALRRLAGTSKAKEGVNPVEVNPLKLQDLFERILSDLEQAENELYNDEFSARLRELCKERRQQYRDLLREIMDERKHYPYV